MTLILFYKSLILSYAKKADIHTIYTPLSNVINLIGASSTFFTRKCAEKAATTSKLGDFVLKTLKTQVGIETTMEELEQINQSIMSSYPQLDEWFDFASKLFAEACSNDSQNIQEALDVWTACGRQYFSERNRVNLTSWSTALDMFLTAIRGPRDIGYAEIFLEERPNTPKEKLALVFFGSNHAPGFKKALLEKHRGLEKKKPLESKKNDSDKSLSSTSGPSEKKSTEEKKKKRRR